MSQEQFEKLTQKLDTLIRLFAGNLLKDAKNKTQKVEFLHNLGVSTKEIAELVDTTEASVETLKTRLRRRARRTKRASQKGG